MSVKKYNSLASAEEDTFAILDNVSAIIENLQQITQKGDDANGTIKQERHLLREYNSFPSAQKHNKLKRNSSYNDVEEITQDQSSPLLQRCNTFQSSSRPSLSKKSSKNTDGLVKVESEKNIKSTFLRRYASFQSALKPSKYKKNSMQRNENLDEENGEVVKEETKIKSTLLRRYASFQSALRPSRNKSHSSSEHLREETSEKKGSPFLQRYGSFQSSLRPKLRTVKTGFAKLSCVTRNNEEEIPMEPTFRHKSIDIGVGLARKMSLFMFTKRTVCVHPYHPYTPPQSSRKINFGFDNKT